MSDIEDATLNEDYGVYVKCGKCDFEFNFLKTSFEHEDEMLAQLSTYRNGEYRKHGFTCPNCETEHIAYWSNKRMRELREKLIAVRTKILTSKYVTRQDKIAFNKYKKSYTKLRKSVQRKAHSGLRKASKVST